MGTETARREDDRQMGRILVLLERIDQQQQDMNEQLREIIIGATQLPQCRHHEHRIGELEKNVNLHNCGDLHRRLIVLEQHEAERKDASKWTFRQVVGPVISGAIGAALAYLGMKR